jgi:hypothetical protein
MKLLARLMPFLPLSFILLLSALEITIIDEELDMNDPYDYERDDYDEEEDDRYLKVAIVEDKAYWVVNNVFYEADVVDEEIIKEDAKPVDAFDMDFREVTKMMTILDNIQDWKN